MQTITLRRWTIVMLVAMAVLLALDPVNAGGMCIYDKTGTIDQWVCLP